MKFLAVSTNTKDVTPFAEEEFKRADELAAAGTVTSGWLKADFSGAVLIVEAADEADALAALNTLPSVINEATTFALTAILDMESARLGSPIW